MNHRVKVMFLTAAASDLLTFVAPGNCWHWLASHTADDEPRRVEDGMLRTFCIKERNVFCSRKVRDIR